MHGQHLEDKQQQKWHMWPAPLQRFHAGTDAESAHVKSFSKAGRTIGVGDCALFQAENAPPFIGIIRRLITDKEGNLKLNVNWLYRPSELKLGKGASVEAAPNEIFYSFHKDEISAAYLLHPCKVAFLRKGIELPPGVSSFVCRRVYDTANKQLYWLTDQDYTDDHQAEVDQLLDKTKHEMQASTHSQGTSPRTASAPASSKADTLNVSQQGRGKKRDRTDQIIDQGKREKMIKVEDADLKEENNIGFEEFATFADKDRGLNSTLSAEQLVQVMIQERSGGSRKMSDMVSRRMFLASIIAATDKEDCLARLVQLGGLPVLDDWLQEAHKGKLGDGSPRDSDKALEELLLMLLRALDKLPVDLDALKTCMVGKSVNNLKSHKNIEVQKKARKLVDTWKKRVESEMKSSDEGKSGFNNEGKSGLNTTSSWSSKPVNETQSSKGRPAKNIATAKIASNGCSANVDTRVSASSHPGTATTKDNSGKLNVSSTNDVLSPAKEEKSCSSSHSHNSQSWGSGSGKGIGSSKDEVKAPVTSFGSKTSAAALRNQGHGHATKSHSAPFSSGLQRETTAKNKASAVEKGNSCTLDKGSTEGCRAETSNSQRLIVRLPNPARSPAHSVNGATVADCSGPSNRVSSPGSTDKQDSVNVSSRMHSHSPETSGDVKCGNSNNTNSGKSRGECKEEMDRSDTPTMCGDVHLKPSSNETTREQEAEKNQSDMRLMTIKEDDDNAEGGIDLLARVATIEGSEPGTSALAEGRPHVFNVLQESMIEDSIMTNPECKKLLQEDGDKKEEEITVRELSDKNIDSMMECSLQHDDVLVADADDQNVSGLANDQVMEDAKESIFSSVKEVTDSRKSDVEDKSDIEMKEAESNEENLPKLSVDSNDLDSVTQVVQKSERSLMDNSEETHILSSVLSTHALEPVSCKESASIAEESDEEDALTVARQVAKEVEQEMEEFNKFETHAAISTSSSRLNPKLENIAVQNLKDGLLVDGSDSSMEDPTIKTSTNVECADVSEVNVVTPIEKEDIVTNAAANKGEVVNEEEAPLKDTENATSCANEKDMDKDERDMDGSTIPSEFAGPTLPATEETVVNVTIPSSSDETVSKKDVERPVFDLNEGFGEDAIHDGQPNSSSALVSSDPPCHLSQTGSLAAPVAIVSATKGAFIPPSNLVKTREAGWKGSAATSAFRPAEPRHTAETWQSALDATVTPTKEDSIQSSRKVRFLDIDLNVADERVVEDSATLGGEQSQLCIGSSNENSSANNGPAVLRPALDLNRVDESDESMGAAAVSLSRHANPPAESNTAARVILDIDLNDGPTLEDVALEEIPQQKSVGNANIVSVAGMGPSSDFSNSSLWYSHGVSMPGSIITPAFSVNRTDSASSVITTSNAKPVMTGQSLGSITGDPYQGAAASVSYTTTVPSPFSYTSFPFGGLFPFSSASFSVTQQATSASTVNFAAGGPQLVGPGAVLSPYARPYIISGVGAVQTADPSSTWVRPNLDLNAGPDVYAEPDARDDAFGPRVAAGLTQFSYPQIGPSGGGVLKRNEPESGFDQYRSGFKQMTWQ